eukprot:gb/GFBE01082436.1/.p1 GENE.gb/GFBE01082436.1/~~gb/GFBE01082436.1/.p1  ORF type:complete len:236 (+),score=11.93 gb/GFBE01082436.1/:1-708(+)
MMGSRGLWRDLPRYGPGGKLESTGPEVRHPVSALSPRGPRSDSSGGYASARVGDARTSPRKLHSSSASTAAEPTDEVEYAGQRPSVRIAVVNDPSDTTRRRSMSRDRTWYLHEMDGSQPSNMDLAPAGAKMGDQEDSRPRSVSPFLRRRSSLSPQPQRPAPAPKEDHGASHAAAEQRLVGWMSLGDDDCIGGLAQALMSPKRSSTRRPSAASALNHRIGGKILLPRRSVSPLQRR